ncbi:alpha and gamma adaptin binding protein p34-domain-containing protein [Aspergillus welwitschiae]|uniref:Alpha and gamma adaptin binding protein p34-domain-containing protein n=1 Tax=Aspergillus welwitschiae TaxID=1341132 RepID=A0A3F3PPD6_9EURO|nr:alpha and gamma adaptin binding protein p34-domain-containing protein [Aspergillus welwitschiae]RDH28811.1 alpha and gamma adaptin binding protein p34-domain-containing protein [Aspergillus welwitschiae]
MPPTTTSTTSNPTPITNPRRLLILTPTTHSQSIVPPLLHSLTGTPVTTPPTAPASSSPTPTPTLSSATTLAASSTTSIASSTTITTFAGYTTHPPLHLSNKYYTADVPIWVDEIPLLTPDSSEPTPSVSGSTISPAQWKTEFSSPEAQVVRDAIGAVMICFRNPVQMDPVPGQEQQDVEDRADVRGLKEFVKAVGEVRALIEEERGGVGEVPGLVVLVGEKKTGSGKVGSGGGGEEDEDGLGLEIDEVFSEGWWEDQVCEMGLMGMEVVRWGGKEGEEEEEGRNRYGELQGMRRIKEVLETHDWAATEDAETGLLHDGVDDDLERELLGLDDADNGFDLEVDELQREMVGLRMAIERGGGDGFDDDDEGDEELRVDAVEALLLRMRAIKDISDELPEAERKRFAAKAVRDIMREM